MEATLSSILYSHLKRDWFCVTLSSPAIGAFTCTVKAEHEDAAYRRARELMTKWSGCTGPTGPMLVQMTSLKEITS